MYFNSSECASQYHAQTSLGAIKLSLGDTIVYMLKYALGWGLLFFSHLYRKVAKQCEWCINIFYKTRLYLKLYYAYFVVIVYKHIPIWVFKTNYKEHIFHFFDQ